MFLKNSKYEDMKPVDKAGAEKLNRKIFLTTFSIFSLLVFTLWVLTFCDDDYESYSEKITPFSHPDYLGFIERNALNANFEWENDKECTITNDAEKFDCYPEAGGNENSCINRRCCWMPLSSEASSGVPWCYYPKNYKGYEIVNQTTSKTGITAFLSRTFPSPYPDDVKLIKFSMVYQSKERIRVKITDANSNRYEPPYPDIPVASEKSFKNPFYKVKLSLPGFTIMRNDDNILLDANNVGGFIFADQFLQVSMKFKGNIYGLGEHQSTLQLSTNWTKFTMFNHDGIPLPNANLYGSHPFYLVVEPDGKSHGVFFHNSNAMEVLLQPLPAVTFRAIGGIFDFYIFTGPTPGDVIKQYTEVIGRTFFPPYWSLGFHLSRFGYKDTEDIRKVWKRTREAEIPFDTQWHDLDYMDKRNDFTYDKVRYKDLAEFVAEVHDAGMHYVPILDPGISGCEPRGTYPPFDEGLVSNVFIKNENGSLFVGKVWNPKCTVFPDFTSLNASSYWSKQIRKFHDLISFDGLWIDMNEPSNFLDGSVEGCPSNKWENPPYVPEVVGGKLKDKTVCMSARQAAGLHYDLHNLYGISEAVATYRALLDLGKRPFIISRSTYPGIGRFAGHWSGDVVSTWNAMKKSISQMLSFSLFGVPMMGADICGFNGNTTATLCQRWSQLGAFYPFSRNHNSDDNIDQDPVALGADVVKAAKKALEVRYNLLPYLYTLFYKAHTDGETVARPLFFEFWNDPKTLSLDESFLWGCCVLLVPVLKEYATTVKTYLPAARWYDWYTSLGIESNGTEVVLHAPSDTIPVFVRGGVVLPTQASSVTTTLSRRNNIDLVAASNASLYASGTLFWDDGESFDTSKTGEFGIVDFLLTPVNFSSRVRQWGCKEIPQLGSIKILGFVKPITRLYFNEKEIKYNWNPTSLVLRVNVTYPINTPFLLEWKLAKP